MAFQPVANVAEVVVRCLADNQDVLNTFHFFNPTAWGSSELSQLVAGVKERWDDHFIPLLPSALSSVLVDGKGLRTAVDVAVFEAWAAPAAGGNPNAAMPNNVTLSVSERTGLTGRSARGRNYWPLTPREHITANTFSSAYITAITAAYNTLVGLGTVAVGWQLVVVSRWISGTRRPSGAWLDVENYVVVDNIVDSQRRRLPKRGT